MNNVINNAENALIKASIVRNNVMRKVKCATAIEYFLILALVAAIVIAAFNILTPIITNKVTSVGNTITNAGSSP